MKAKHVCLTNSFAVTAVALLLTQCATIFDGTKQQVTFTSPQRGAKVTVENRDYATPATITISKKTTSATFSAPKCVPREIAWDRDFQWGYLFLDILFTPGWGLSGCLTDGITNAWMKQPPVVDYNLATGTSNVKLQSK